MPHFRVLPRVERSLLPQVEQERLGRIENMMLALQEALDKVYDADADRQLHRLAHDYCVLNGQPVCGQCQCEKEEVPADCPVLEQDSKTAS